MTEVNATNSKRLLVFALQFFEPAARQHKIGKSYSAQELCRHLLTRHAKNAAPVLSSGTNGGDTDLAQMGETQLDTDSPRTSEDARAYILVSWTKPALTPSPQVVQPALRTLAKTLADNHFAFGYGTFSPVLPLTSQ